MKKQSFTILSLILILSIGIIGCGKEKAESVTVPDTVVIEASTPEEPASEPVIEEPVEEVPVEEEPTEEIMEEEPEYDMWYDLYDYNLNQEVLAPDGEFKNLTLQPGNTPDSVNITWFSKSSSKGKVTFETEGLFHNITAKAKTEPSVSVPGYYRNSATIEGLESDSVYYYTLKNGGSTSPVYKYKTGDLYTTDFTFTVAGDPEIGLGDPEVLPGHRSVWRVVLNRMKADIPESSFLVTTGDQVADPASSVHYDYFLDNSVLYSTPLVPLVGNHDSGTGYFGDHFTLPNMSSIGVTNGRDGDYWFTKGNALFMVLNSMDPNPTEVHEQFVAESIAANPDAKWRIILSHYSPITMVERYQSIRDVISDEYNYMGDVFDIDLFIGGHDHIYTRGYFIDGDGNRVEGTTLEYEFHNPGEPVYIIANGATDALLREPDEDYPWAAVSVQNGVPGLLEVRVTDEFINVEAHDADTWAIVDKFTIYKD